MRMIVKGPVSRKFCEPTVKGPKPSKALTSWGDFPVYRAIVSRVETPALLHCQHPSRSQFPHPTLFQELETHSFKTARRLSGTEKSRKQPFNVVACRGHHGPHENTAYPRPKPHCTRLLPRLALPPSFQEASIHSSISIMHHKTQKLKYVSSLYLRPSRAGKHAYFSMAGGPHIRTKVESPGGGMRSSTICRSACPHADNAVRVSKHIGRRRASEGRYTRIIGVMCIVNPDLLQR